MTQIIKEIRKILGKNHSNLFNINICSDGIWFEIYENEISLIIDVKTKYVYLDCEASCHHLTIDMLNELYQIARLLQDNIDKILELLKDD